MEFYCAFMFRKEQLWRAASSAYMKTIRKTKSSGSFYSLNKRVS